MPKLRRHRRDPRARAGKRRKRRNLVKFIPEADRDFAFTAMCFVWRLRSDPQGHGVSHEQLAEIETAVKDFRGALATLLQARVGGGQSPQMKMRKDRAREKAEEVVRRYAHIIRANPDVSAINKRLLRLKPRPKKLGKRKCPKSPPTLQFLGSGDGVVGGAGMVGGGSGVHVLRFFDASNGGLTIKRSDTMHTDRRAKPDGAVRVELYFDMIPVGEPVPNHPGERGGWPKYLRSFTRSPIEVQYPIPVEGPMLIVYWARWADSTGEVSRWSQTCVARVEGWTVNAVLPAADDGKALEARRVETKYVFVQTPIAGALPDAGGLEGDELRDEIAALEGRRGALGQHVLAAATAKMFDAA